MFEALRAAVGPVMLQRSSAVRRGIERRMLEHSEAVREMYGEPCSMERQRVCARLMLNSVRDISPGVPGRYALVQHRLGHLLDDLHAHEQLAETRPEIGQVVER